jgi:glyoxylase-like metal-dependent hydrolase (beta-lactamase superfamily II)
VGLEIRRLHLASLQLEGVDTPVHGFVVMHPKGAILIDTGVGGPEKVLTDWRCVNRTMADALADHDLVPGDISLVVNTHLHFDHCGQNAVFRHAPFYVQRTELERARREAAWLTDWFDFAGARFELLDGSTEIAPGVRTVATPGHTVGHQSVVVEGDGEELLVGDAAYTPAIYLNPDTERLPGGQAADHDEWRATLNRLHASRPRHVHFCHHTRVLHGQ